MKISVDWLNSYLDRPVNADEAQRALTDQGLPIESRTPVGESGGDTLLDVEVTSNRADCLCHVGVAHDVAAGLDRGLVLPPCTLQEPQPTTSTDTAGEVAVDNQEPALCPLYTARVIHGIRVGPSPAWLVRRLEAVGLRSVNNVVDVTNFVLLELGQPLHAFDLDLLEGRRVIVRKARRGESIVTIDSAAHELDPDMLVIADASRPVAIAGVMGGNNTGVTPQTSQVLLESALFDPVSVRRTSRALKLASDSSYRFERGVDPAATETASRRAAELICQLTGGKVAGGLVRAGGPVPASRTVQLRPERCNRLLGLRLTPRRMAGLLDRLGFAPDLDNQSDLITCQVPTRRVDVQREVDLIEEVARLHGFDAIPVHEKIHIVTRPPSRAVNAKKTLGRVLVAHGYHETITFSFIDPRMGEPFVPQDHHPAGIQDPQRRADSMLRPSILPSLLACRKVNQDVGNTAVRLYETAATWTNHRGRIVEQNRLGMLCDALDAQMELRRMRGTIAELADRLTGSGGLDFVPADIANFASAAWIELDGKRIGHAGLIATACQSLFELQSPVVAGELELDALVNAERADRAVRQLPRFPGIGRDLSVIVEEPVLWSDVHRQVVATQPELLEDLVFKGVYRGKPIASGKKSFTFRLLFRDPNATLRHEQVDGQIAAVVARLEDQLAAKLRS